MKQKFLYLFFCFAILSTASKAQDRDLEVVNGITWYLTKKDAMEVALEQGKYVFLMWGNRSCPRCDEFKSGEPVCFLYSIIGKNYILWFSDGEKYDRDSTEVSDYLSSYPKGGIQQPVFCVINPSDPTNGYGHRNGIYDVDDLYDMLEKSLNNYILPDFGKVLVYFSGNNIVVQGDLADESVSVYSLTGSLVDRFNKTGYSCSRSSASYPKGVLIVVGEAGWVRKVTVR